MPKQSLEIFLETSASYRQHDLPEDTCQQAREPRRERRAASWTLQRRPVPECSSLPGSVCRSAAAAPAGVPEDAGIYTEDSYADTCPAVSTDILFQSLCQQFCVSIVLKQVMLGNNKATKLLFEKAGPYHIFRYRTLNKSDPFVVQTAAEFL